MSPGPSLAVVLRHTLSGGRLNGCLAALAHGAGIGLYALLSISGLAVLITASPGLFRAFQWAGAAYLAWMGLRGLLSRKSELFTTLEVRGDSRYLDYFLRFHEDDIRNYREDFRFEPREDQIRVFVLRDLVPAGLLIGRPCADHAFEVELDYVIPRYRDLRIAEFLFSPSSGVFTDPLCKRAWSRPGTSSNVEYLEKMGFERAADDDGSTIYVKDLAPAEP